jgi:hypothetical protein
MATITRATLGYRTFQPASLKHALFSRSECEPSAVYSVALLLCHLSSCRTKTFLIVMEIRSCAAQINDLWTAISLHRKPQYRKKLSTPRTNEVYLHLFHCLFHTPHFNQRSHAVAYKNGSKLTSFS